MSDKRVSKWGKVLVTLLLLPAAVIVPILSLESHYAPPTQAQTQPDASQSQRISSYKAALGREVSNAELTKMKLRCSVAQTNAKSLASRLATVQKKRNTAYDSIQKSLNTLLTSLQAQAFETSSLQENINSLKTKVDKFKNDMNDYYQAVSDLATLDCANDPLAFIAALQAARKAHDAVIPQISDIRATIANTIKPTLTQIRTQLANGQTVGGSQ